MLTRYDTKVLHLTVDEYKVMSLRYVEILEEHKARELAKLVLASYLVPPTY